ncbi:MAG TPA: TolC family protein [Candidatus Nitrosocosmicus sp.]|nr:TolC family protein [Candidatus Nitrosocosmicus sp.]
MRKLCKALALTLCTVMLLSTLTVVGDPGGKQILTLEEAKKLALENNTQFKLQDNYIKQSQEDYNDESENFTENVRGRYSSVAQKAEARIKNILGLDALYSKVEEDVFKKNDLKRKISYDVTTAYYDVMKARYTLDNATRAMDLAKKNLDIAKIKLEHGLITNSMLLQIENAYKTTQIEYNKAVSDLQNDMATLSKNIGGKLDISNYEVDMTIGLPDVSAIKLDKIKEDYIKNSSDFYTLKETLDTAKSKKFMTEGEYEDYLEDTHNKSKNVQDEFSDLITNANRDYDNVKYKYDEAEKALDISLSSQYAAIISTMDTIENLRKSVENARTTFEQSKTKYELGLVSKNEFENNESNLKDLENQLKMTIIGLNTQYLALTQYSYTSTK